MCVREMYLLQSNVICESFTDCQGQQVSLSLKQDYSEKKKKKDN